MTPPKTSFPSADSASRPQKTGAVRGGRVLNLLVLALAAGAGFALTRDGAGRISRTGGLFGVEPSQPPPALVRGEADVSSRKGGSPGAQDKKSPPASGAALAEQLRAALEMEGLDASWVGDLAAEDTAGFPALLEKMQASPGITARARLTELLMARWVMLDAAGGAEFFRAKNDDPNLSRLLGQWQRLDFPAAIAKGEECGPEYLRRTLRDKGMSDPAGLMDWLRERPALNPLSVFPFGEGGSREVLMRLAERDPHRMLDWLRQAPRQPERKGGEDDSADFAMQFAGLLARTHLEEALAWARSIPDSSHSVKALAGIAETLAASDPVRALALLATLPPGPEDDWQYRILGALDLSDPGKARALADSLPKDSHRRQWLLQSTLNGLFVKDPAEAFAFADSLTAAEGGADWGDPPVETLTPEGARRLMEAAAEAKDSTFRDTAVRKSLLAWMEKDPGSLAAWLKGKMETPLLTSMRESLQEGLAMRSILYGQADPALLEEVGLPPEAMVKSLRNIDPARAAEILKTMPNPDPAMVSDIAMRMDWDESLALADSVQSPEAQAAVWKMLAERRVLQDSRRTSEWIATLPAGKGRDTAVLAMTSEIQKTDPDLAWGWALSMSDPLLKNQALAAAARAWSRRDSVSFQEALGNARLTPTEDQAVQAKLKAGPYD